MKREIIPIESEEQWLIARSQDITSTQSSALFGLSPYHTKFELYHAKRDEIILPFKDNERVQKGKRMEAYAAQEIAEKNGWEVNYLNIYARIPEIRMGSSFDYEVNCPKRGKGLLEIKGVDWKIYKNDWSDDEIPPHYEIQARQEMLCGDYNWVCVAAFTSIYEHHEHYFERDEAFECGLISTVKSFWADVATGNAPEPDFSRDGKAIAQLYKNAGGDEVDLSTDNELPDLIERFQQADREEKEWDKKKDAIKAEIHNKMGSRAVGFTSGVRIDTGWTKGSSGKEVTADMVGTIIGAKAGYRKLAIKPFKKGE